MVILYLTIAYAVTIGTTRDEMLRVLKLSNVHRAVSAIPTPPNSVQWITLNEHTQNFHIIKQ